MTRQTQTILYHLLPVAFWLPAIGGTIPFARYYYFGYLVALLVLIAIGIIGRIKRHSPSVEQCFMMAVLLGIASYWLPSVIFLTLAFWGYLIYHNLFSTRSFLATLIGYATVAIWAAVFIAMGWISNPWSAFFAKENALGWIPLGAILLAWLFSTIARQTLRVR